MSQLIRMDRTVTRRWREWSAEDPAARRGRGRRVSGRARPGLLTPSSRRARVTPSRSASSRRRAAGDPAPSDRRGLEPRRRTVQAARASARAAPRAGQRLLAPAGQRALAAPGRHGYGRLHRGPHGAVHRRRRLLGVLNPVTIAGLGRAAGARLDHPRALRGPGRRRRANARGRRPATRSASRSGCSATSSTTAARELHARTGLVQERGGLGTWLVGEAGALLVRPGGRRVHCYCVKATDPELPPSDRIAHLLLALRADEAGFATVANLAFSGAAWRLRRRLPNRARTALAAAVARERSAASANRSASGAARRTARALTGSPPAARRTLTL